MQVKKIMTKNPACCTPDSTLQEVAHMMEMYDCGCIPVVENHQTKHPIGTITDRDITIRTFSAGKNLTKMKASDIMTSNIVTVKPETDIKECMDVMEDKQIRRILVVDKSGRCVGIVAQADLVEHANNQGETAKFIREVSESDHSSDRMYESERSGGNERRMNRQNNRSFTKPHNKPRQMHRQPSVEKESLFTGKTLLTLLGSIGLGAGLSYYFGIGEENNKHHSYKSHKTKTYNLDAKNTENKQTSDLSNYTPSTSFDTTPLSSSPIGTTRSQDTITGSVVSSGRINDDTDVESITEISRTATNR